jgi:hypothetical protein
MTVQLTESKEGVLLPIKARAAGKKNAIVGEHGGALRVSVTAPAERGKANAAIIDLLADLLAVRKSDLQIIRGATSSEKLVRVVGVDRQSLDDRIRRLLTPAG